MDQVTWLGLTHGQIADQLRSKFLVEEISVPRLLEMITKLPPILREEFRNYWENGVIESKVSINGYNIEKVIREKRVEPIGAFSVLNWLIEKPEEATEALNHRWSQYHPT